MQAHSTASTAGRSWDPTPRLACRVEFAQGLGGRHGSGGLEFVQHDLAGEQAGEEEVAGAAEVIYRQREIAAP